MRLDRFPGVGPALATALLMWDRYEKYRDALSNAFAASNILAVAADLARTLPE
jgi:hypothetical protein